METNRIYKEQLKPIGNTFLFEFVEKISNDGGFIPEQTGLIERVVCKDEVENSSKPRMGRVIAIGPKVSLFKKGDIVWIEALKWTLRFQLADGYIHKSDEDQVIAVVK